jgi:hypothetical protein
MEPNVDSCRERCALYRRTTVFELCGHKAAQYSIAGKLDQHTVQHMRRHQCGTSAQLFSGRTS